MEQDRKDILEAIAFFEQILQTMPDDLVSLEFLGDAYEQVGEEDKARRSWKQLAQCVLKEFEVEHARSIRPRLAPYLDDQEVAMSASRLDALIREADTRKHSMVTPAQGVGPTKLSVNLKPAQLRMAAAFEEVNLAWLLHENGFLDAVEYEDLTADMTEGGAGIPDFPVSSLLGLHRLHPDKTDAALALLHTLHHLVPLRLDLFQFTDEVKALLPIPFVRVRGAFPFAKLGSTAIVALLNPADEKLREEVEALAGCPCLFFLAHPAHLDAAWSAYPIPAVA